MASLSWCRGSRPGDHRRDEDAHRQEAGGDEEQRQLHVPRAREVVGEPGGEVEAVEAAGLDVVVGVGPAQQPLDQEQPGDDQEVPGRGPLRGREPHLLRRAEPQRLRRSPLVGAVPAQQVVAPERRTGRARSRPAARSGSARSRATPRRSGCCPPAVRAASCWCTSRTRRAASPTPPSRPGEVGGEIAHVGRRRDLDALRPPLFLGRRRRTRGRRRASGRTRRPGRP